MKDLSNENKKSYTTLVFICITFISLIILYLLVMIYALKIKDPFNTDSSIDSTQESSELIISTEETSIEYITDETEVISNKDDGIILNPKIIKEIEEETPAISSTTSSSEELSILSRDDYIEIDVAILKNIKEYHESNYNYLIMVGTNISHANGIVVTETIASNDYIDKIYNYIENYDNTILYTDWEELKKECSYLAKDMKYNLGVDVSSYRITIIKNEDYNTELLTVDDEGNVIYDIFKNK